MAVELTDKENDSLNNLSENMHSILNRYKEEKSRASKGELEVELRNLNDYLEGCRKSEIDDTLTNIRFCEAKTIVLEGLISDKLSGAQKEDSLTDKKDYPGICESIAGDIESIKEEFPQLMEFEISKNVDKQSCKIEYEYQCHESDQNVGWRRGMPNPDATGVWFHIQLWDPNDKENISQINTQPFLPVRYIRDWRVTYLIVEGNMTASLKSRILEILRKHGLKEN